MKQNIARWLANAAPPTRQFVRKRNVGTHERRQRYVEAFTAVKLRNRVGNLCHCFFWIARYTIFVLLC